MALTGMAVMAALALAKNQLIDQPAADRKRKYEANTAALSPWTHMQSQYVDDPNAIGAVIGGAGAGAAMGSEISKSNLNDSLAGNPAISGATADSPLGGMALSDKLGAQASNFSKSSPSSWSGVAANEKVGSPGSDPYWSFGHGLGQQYSQPSLSSPVDPNAQPAWMSLKNPQDPYKSLHAKGLSEKNPEENWQTNQFRANY